MSAALARLSKISAPLLDRMDLHVELTPVTYEQLTPTGLHLLKTAMERLQRSARACNCILKVARTAPELANSPDKRMEYLGEAIHYRNLDWEEWPGGGIAPGIGANPAERLRVDPPPVVNEEISPFDRRTREHLVYNSRNAEPLDSDSSLISILPKLTGFYIFVLRMRKVRMSSYCEQP